MGNLPHGEDPPAGSDDSTEIHSRISRMEMQHKVHRTSGKDFTIFRIFPRLLQALYISLCLSSDPTSQLYVLRLDSHSLAMYGTEVGIIKQSNHVCFSCFLQVTSVG
jgi:hypothetical protein